MKFGLGPATIPAASVAHAILGMTLQEVNRLWAPKRPLKAEGFS